MPSSYRQTKLSTAVIANIAVELCKLSDEERERFPDCLQLAFSEFSKYELIIQSAAAAEGSEDEKTNVIAT